MLTVDKLIKTKKYEEKHKKELEETHTKAVFNLPIFNQVTTEEEWVKSKEETNRDKESDLKIHLLELENKRQETHQQLEKAKTKKQLSLPIFNNITSESAWKRERNKLRTEYNKIQQIRLRTKEEATKDKNNDLYKKVLEYRDGLQNHHTKRMNQHAARLQKEQQTKNAFEWYSNEKEEQLKRLRRREEMNSINKKSQS